MNKNYKIYLPHRPAGNTLHKFANLRTRYCGAVRAGHNILQGLLF